MGCRSFRLWQPHCEMPWMFGSAIMVLEISSLLSNLDRTGRIAPFPEMAVEAWSYKRDSLAAGLAFFMRTAPIGRPQCAACAMSATVRARALRRWRPSLAASCPTSGRRSRRDPTALPHKASSASLYDWPRFAPSSQRISGSPIGSGAVAPQRGCLLSSIVTPAAGRGLRDGAGLPAARPSRHLPSLACCRKTWGDESSTPPIGTRGEVASTIAELVAEGSPALGSGLRASLRGLARGRLGADPTAKECLKSTQAV